MKRPVFQMTNHLEESMSLSSIRRLGGLVLAALLIGMPFVASAQEDLTVGVSWSNFQLERWKTDEAAIKKSLEAHGAKYISADAGGSSEKQLSDVESLITRGADVLIVLAWDANAIMPAVSRAEAMGIPVIAYDRLIESPGVFYLTFDNIEVGRMQARAVHDQQPTGNYVFIKGAPTDPNADFLHQGQLDVLQPHIDSGDIKVVGEQYTEGWRPEVAQRNMEQILTRTDNNVDAVVASNDSTAGGAVAALEAQGMAGIPVSGQDADTAALNRIARGTQTVTVWKDSRDLGRKAGEIAVALGQGTPMDEIEGAGTWSGGPKGLELTSLLLKPVPVTRENLNVVIEADWIERETLCRGVSENPPAACQ